MIDFGWVAYSGHATWARPGRRVRARADSYAGITLRYTQESCSTPGVELSGNRIAVYLWQPESGLLRRKVCPHGTEGSGASRRRPRRWRGGRDRIVLARWRHL